MQPQPTEKVFYTKEEYLLLEEQSNVRHEYHRGEVIAMAGGTLEHSQITSNTIRVLGNAIGSKNCRILTSDLKVELADSYVYPDAFVICGDVEFAKDRKDIVKNPCLLVEVLSEGTEQYDRGDKFEEYRKISTFKEYVLISQSKPSVEVFYKQDEKHWLMTVITDLDDVVPLQSIDAAISMREIYNKVF